MQCSIAFDCERMKYLHTGLYYYCFHLGKALIEQLSFYSKYDLTLYVPPEIKNLFGHRPQYLIQSSLHKLYMSFASKYNIWHCTYQGSNYYPASSKCKILLTVHDLNFMHEEKKSLAKKKKYLHALQEKVNRADSITVISEFVKNDLLNHVNIDNKQVSVIYNGCNIEPLQNLVPPTLIPLHPFLYTIGTIAEKKNFHVLPALLKYNEFDLVISGITLNKSYKEKILQEARKSGIADRLFFTDAVSENDKQWYMQHCTAFVFPSLMEGFGLPVVEAMRFGKPLLLSKYSSLPEIGGDVAYYFDNFEPEHMQQILTESLNHYSNTNARSAIEKRAYKYSWQRAATQYLSIYHSLVE